MESFLQKCPIWTIASWPAVQISSWELTSSSSWRPLILALVWGQLACYPYLLEWFAPLLPFSSTSHEWKYWIHIFCELAFLKVSLFYFHNHSFLLINFKVQVTSENSESIVPFSSFYGASIQKNNAILILDPLTANFFFLSGKFENNFVPNILKF